MFSFYPFLHLVVKCPFLYIYKLCVFCSTVGVIISGKKTGSLTVFNFSDHC